MNLFYKAYLAIHGLRKKYRPRHLGDLNLDRTVFVSRARSVKYDGLMSLVTMSFVAMSAAEERGWLTVIDGANRPSLTDPDPVFGTTNPWEYYFEQPDGISIDEASNSRNVVGAIKMLDSMTPATNNRLYAGDSDILRTLCELAARKIRFNSRTAEYLSAQWSQLGIADAKNLAVMSRGTDYKKMRPAGHEIQPEPEELLDCAVRMDAEKRFDYIYLNTEELFVRRIFEAEFGSRLRFFESTYYDDYNSTIGSATPIDYVKNQDRFIGAYIAKHSEKSKYLLNLEYLRNIWAASRCDSLICGFNSGTIAAVLFNNFRYSYKNMIFKGFY